MGKASNKKKDAKLTPEQATEATGITKITIVINEEERALLTAEKKKGTETSEAIRIALSVWKWALEEVRDGRHIESADYDGRNRKRVTWAGGIGE